MLIVNKSKKVKKIYVEKYQNNDENKKNFGIKIATDMYSFEISFLHLIVDCTNIDRNKEAANTI